MVRVLFLNMITGTNKTLDAESVQVTYNLLRDDNDNELARKVPLFETWTDPDGNEWTDFTVEAISENPQG